MSGHSRISKLLVGIQGRPAQQTKCPNGWLHQQTKDACGGHKAGLPWQTMWPQGKPASADQVPTRLGCLDRLSAHKAGLPQHTKKCLWGTHGRPASAGAPMVTRLAE